jgi:hypothetical protein
MNGALEELTAEGAATAATEQLAVPWPTCHECSETHPPAEPCCSRDCFAVTIHLSPPTAMAKSMRDSVPTRRCVGLALPARIGSSLGTSLAQGYGASVTRE